jgi:hypothetical protein
LLKGKRDESLAQERAIAQDERASHGRNRTKRSRYKVTKTAALESAGVIFVDENGEVPGVRLRKRAAGTKAASIPIEELNTENDE